MVCAPFVSFGLTGPDRNGRGRERHRGNKKAPGQHKAIRAHKVRYSVKKRRFSHPSLDCTCWATWIFLTVAKIPSEFVGGQIVSWQLPPVSRRICQRQRVIPFEGKKNGGLEMSFKTADGGSNLKIGARNYLPRSNGFFLSPGGADSSLLSNVYGIFIDTESNQLSADTFVTEQGVDFVLRQQK